MYKSIVHPILDVNKSEGELPVHKVDTLVVMKNELLNASFPIQERPEIVFPLLCKEYFGIRQISRDQIEVIKVCLSWHDFALCRL